MKAFGIRIGILLLLGILKTNLCLAYSVLTHEAIIDAVWDKYLAPLLRSRYTLSDSALKKAHAYAYGGAISPDMGYFPFGSKLFTNLVHYVRSGDYVMALLDEAQNANEYAFALGSMCHYYADVYGHSLGVNVDVPLIYPKEKEKFGNWVTYEEDHASHKRIEFAFDVVQSAQGNYASTSYHDFIGFQVSKEVMDRAFFKTYALHIDDLFHNFNRAVGTFRWTVRAIFPEITKVAWATRKKNILKLNAGITGRKFRYHMDRRLYNKEFGRDRDRPQFFTYVLSVLIKIMPKIGPLQPLKFKNLTPAAEKNYIQSFDSVEYHYTTELTHLHHGKAYLVNKDFDTGNNTVQGEYGLTDRTYCDWLMALQNKKFDSLSVSLKKNILQFFSGGNATASKNEKGKDWEKVETALDQLKTVKPED